VTESIGSTPKILDSKNYDRLLGKIKPQGKVLKEYEWRFSLDSYSWRYMMGRWLSDIADLPMLQGYDVFANGSYMIDLLFECFDTELLKIFPPDTIKELKQAQLQTFPLREYDTVTNQFRFASQGKKYFVFSPESFQAKLFSMLREYNLYFQEEAVQLKLIDLQGTKAASLAIFNAQAGSVFKCITWYPTFYSPGMVYPAMKKILSLDLQTKHNQHDWTHQTDPRRQKPRHEGLDLVSMAPITWPDTVDLLTFITTSFQLVPAHSDEVSGPATGSKVIRKVSLVHDPAPSDNTLVPLLANVATLESLEALGNTQNSKLEALGSELKKENSDTKVQLANIHQQMSRLTDSQLLRSRELGAVQPRTHSFSSAKSSPAGKVSFADAKDIPLGTAAAGGASAGGGSRLSMNRGSLPRGACWAFAKGNCTRTDCRFDHVAPDDRARSSLNVAVSCITECEDRWNSGQLDGQDFAGELIHYFTAFPVLAQYSEDIWNGFSLDSAAYAEAPDRQA